MKFDKKSLKNLIYATGIGLAGFTSSFGQEPQFSEKQIIGDVKARINNSGAAIQIIDLNNDDLADIVTADVENIKYFENIGTKNQPKYQKEGKIIGIHNYDVLSASVGLKVAYFNDDELLDIITADPREIKYFENTGTKNQPKYQKEGKVIAELKYPLLDSAIYIDLSDMNDDNKLDIIVGTPRNIYYFPQQ